MFSRFRGKGSDPKDPSTDASSKPRGLEVVEDDPDTAWGLWDSALAEQESRFGSTEPEATDSVSVRPPGPPPLTDVDIYVSTQPLGLEEKSVEQRRDEALAVVEMHHHRIANTIRTLWGYKECSVYIYKLIMNGGDGMGHARIGFNQDAAAAMMALAELHDAQFGAEEVGKLGFGDPTVR
ncbi:MAG: hypothetical protein WCP86_07055 [bacterium]